MNADYGSALHTGVGLETTTNVSYSPEMPFQTLQEVAYLWRQRQWKNDSALPQSGFDESAASPLMGLVMYIIDLLRWQRGPGV